MRHQAQDTFEAGLARRTPASHPEGDALRKIITTLAVKNEEIQNFIYALKQMLQNVEANSTKVQEDLEGEFQSLYSLLDELKEGMLMKIKQDRASRTYELQNQLAACTKALESSEELLEMANQTLEGAENHDFNQHCHTGSYTIDLASLVPPVDASDKDLFSSPPRNALDSAVSPYGEQTPS
ncbi:fibronectin type III and SPRY domain-containing protein 1-like [Chelonoidis abingdonii]|uniref:fibronectin type III and SPRY domain-containing protein 1-like n=1 Tax=Chelonoidis abingdonii TaxID=106734 RepID=UPI003F492B46